MADFEVRNNRHGQPDRLRVRVRKTGFVTQSRLYDFSDGSPIIPKEALRWAARIESEMADLGMHRKEPPTPPPEAKLSIAQALDRYETDLIIRNGDVGNASRARKHLPDNLLNTAVADLTVADLQAWRNSLVGSLAPATINRVMTQLKAALNLAADADEGRTIRSRAPWEIGLSSLADAEEARNVVINDAVIAALIGAAYTESTAFGLFIEVAAVTGSRASQIAALKVDDLQASGEPRLMMPTSKKGRGVKAVRRQPIPIPMSLAEKLRFASHGRPGAAVLLPKSSGGAFITSNDHVRPWNRIRKAANLKPEAIAPYVLEEITLYALRHSSIVRQILRGVPLRVVAALHDTSVAMIERNYSRYIAGQADAIARAALPSFPVVQVPAASPHYRPHQDSQCPHGHSYAEFPPYIAKSGSIACAECARQRTRRNKAAKRTFNDTSPVGDEPRPAPVRRGSTPAL
jgi:integrase